IGEDLRFAEVESWPRAVGGSVGLDRHQNAQRARCAVGVHLLAIERGRVHLRIASTRAEWLCHGLLLSGQSGDSNKLGRAGCRSEPWRQDVAATDNVGIRSR